jgi:hypothetical protein
MTPIITKTPTNNNNGHDPYTCNECHEEFEHKFELNLHIATLHNPSKFSFLINKLK